ncbi:uncharacterized protein RCC_10306 [Ramularia collo-cygni]|uniref:Zn(2)-C6 fungal-type domain-containing protein n=1 Tax=Ramularia collo-cygni TaxID=112498 RepID=A0A2D3VJK3_9PEZI|nr:uncharacterized protein RCC_10306 [Ramularia collo-cygni]CZT24581.1 uncharacterized protein RCC_10306 [Ramularia collo-cygni]
MSAVKHNMSLSMILSPSQDQEPSQQDIRRRSACEECRTKKLKCSGTQPACTRCVREGITCFYSPQKTMGRPKKRERSEERSQSDEPTRRRKSGPSPRTNAGDGTVVQPPEQQQMPDKSPAQNASPAYDMGSYASAFTSDGNLQPWVQQSFPGEVATSWNSPSSAVPTLTPDNDSLSSPSAGASFPPADALASTSFQLDPTLSDPPNKTLTIPSCACLSTIYLTLSTINNMKTAADFAFPAALHPLRQAMSTAETVLACEECPKSFSTGLQNTTMLGTLFLSIAERFSKVLEQIELEAARAEKEGERKRFRVTDLNGENGGHLHMGDAECLAAFSLNLSPKEWRVLSKKVVRTEVLGPEDGQGERSGSEAHSHGVYFLALAKQMEDRQNRWHEMPLPEDFPKGWQGMWRPENGQGHEDKAQHHCLKIVGSSKTLVGKFDWS